MGYFKN